MTTLVKIRSDSGSDMSRVVAAAAGILDRRDLAPRVYWGAARSPCLIARYRARVGGRGGVLALHCHLDTAGVEAEGWRVGPLSAAELGGRIFGRGTIDCKGLAAVWMALLLKFARKKEAFPFDLLFVASSDEETGGEGISRMLAETAEFRGTFLALGEGGGFPVRSGALTFYTVQTGEMERWLFEGRPEAKNRGLSLGSVIEGLGSGALTLETLWYSLRVASGLRDPLRSLAPRPLSGEWTAEGAWSRSPFAGQSIPPKGAGRVVSRVETGRPRGSRIGFRAARRALRRQDGRARILPMVTLGYSDNRHFRLAGIPVLGFFPLAAGNSVAGCHGENEYITLDSLRFAENVLESTLLEIKEAIGG